jgi:hypothetical protein
MSHSFSFVKEGDEVARAITESLYSSACIVNATFALCLTGDLLPCAARGRNQWLFHSNETWMLLLGIWLVLYWLASIVPLGRGVADRLPNAGRLGRPS